MSVDTKAREYDRAPHHAQLLAKALESNGGTRDWRDWKASALAEVMGLADQAERMTVLGLGVEADLHITYNVQMPVPRWPRSGELVIGTQVVFDLIYQEHWRWESPPSYMPLAVTHPFDVFHPNCRPSAVPVVSPGSGTIPVPCTMICLGDLPPGTPPKEIVLLGYYVLTLQDRILDELDPRGVFNPAACQYYRDHGEYLPLTRAGLFEPSKATGHETGATI